MKPKLTLVNTKKVNHMMHLYEGKTRIASVKTFLMAEAVAQATRIKLITVKKDGKTEGHFRYGFWEPKEKT